MPAINSFQKKCLAVAMSQLLVSNAHAANIIVTSNTDDGVSCTLREALEAIDKREDTAGCVNSSTEDYGRNDRIEFEESGVISLEQGELNIKGNVIIDASTVSDITIDAQQRSRIMYVNPYESLSLKQLTLTGGLASRSTASDSPYPSGGAIMGGEGSSVTIENSTITENTSTTDGGAIALDSRANLELKNSALTNNTADLYGGAVVGEGRGVNITINNSQFSGNRADYGGAIGNKNGDSGADLSRTTIINSRINNNVAKVAGGGVFIEGNNSVGTTMQGSIQNSTISDNTVYGNSGAYGGGIATRESVLSVTGSTIAGNSATYDSYNGDEGGQGGGLYGSDSNITINNSTISGNSTNGRGGGVLLKDDSPLTLNNATIVSNNAEQSVGGVFSEDTITVQNSIIANSISGADCQASNVISDIQSIIEDASCVSIARAIDPLLGPLANNGGPTNTHKPLTGSPVIDSGSNLNCETIDQRGQTRSLSTADRCDVGSVELGDIDEGTFYAVPLKNGKTVVFEL